jgi:hypothetical protein
MLAFLEHETRVGTAEGKDAMEEIKDEVGQRVC